MKNKGMKRAITVWYRVAIREFDQTIYIVCETPFIRVAIDAKNRLNKHFRYENGKYIIFKSERNGKQNRIIWKEMDKETIEYCEEFSQI